MYNLHFYLITSALLLSILCCYYRLYTTYRVLKTVSVIFPIQYLLNLRDFAGHSRRVGSAPPGSRLTIREAADRERPAGEPQHSPTISMQGMTLPGCGHWPGPDRLLWRADLACRMYRSKVDLIKKRLHYMKLVNQLKIG